MKSLHKYLHFLLIGLFIIGVLYSAYIMYSLPEALEKASGRIDLNAINEAQPVFNSLYLVIGLTLFIGVVVLLRSYYYMSMEDKSIISETEKAGVKAEKTAEQQGIDKESADLKAEVNSLLAGVKGIKDEKSKYEKLLSKLCMKIEASQGIYYKVKKEKNKRFIEMLTSFAFNLPESETLTYEFGEGLAGQVAKEGKKINIDNIPEGYINILSGLGSATPNHLMIIPLKVGKDVVAIAEIASFKEISDADEKLISEVFKIDEVKAEKPAKPSAVKKKEEPGDKSSENKK